MAANVKVGYILLLVLLFRVLETLFLESHLSESAKFEDTSSREAIGLLIPTETISSSSGFQPIYVYRGPIAENSNSNGINSTESMLLEHRENRPVGSQVCQDMIVSEIAMLSQSGSPSPSPTARTHNYFVDLASNDAIYLSNTYRLEKEGWDGLCIGWFGAIATVAWIFSLLSNSIRSIIQRTKSSLLVSISTSEMHCRWISCRWYARCS
mmetsp:Transcript_25623/g.62833  ORF Transcript_25623/g.62833 Transcript_25623/m.62833 type:complete len:210 (+) Transcript_25623:1-630(+)